MKGGGKMEESLCGWRKVEEKGGGRYGEKSKEVWRKNSGFVIRLFYKLSILTIKEDS